MTLLSGSQALAKHSRWLPTVLLEVGRQLGLFIPGIGGFVVLPPVGGERPVVDAFGAARAVGPAISAELLDQAVSGVWADGMTMPLKEAWGEGFAPGTRFVVAVPIKEGAECLGYIVAGLPDRESADAALTSMTLVGVLAGAHVANAQAHEADAVKLHYLAEHDTLVTDLPNRRLFRDRARNVLEQGSAALVFLDLDGFKEVNRDFGYAAGDEVLADVARRWRGIVERECPEATLARMGGDEFAVLLPGGEEERTKELARVLLLALREIGRAHV